MRWIKLIFFNPEEHRLRSLWRIALFLLFAAVLVNPVIIFLDEVYESLLNQTSINFIVAIGFSLSLYLVSRYIDKCKLKDYGIRFSPGAFPDFLYGTLFGSFLVLVIVLILWWTGSILPDQLFYIELAGHSFWILFIFQIFRFLFGSIFEEVFSRAFLIKNISEGIRTRGWMNDKRAIIIVCFFTAFLFGGLHFANPEFSYLAALNLSMLGLLFAFAYIFSRSLFWPIGIHFGWNVLQNIVFGFPNSGKVSEVSVFTFQTHGSALWTGGEFGLEASLLTTIALIIAIEAYLLLIGIKNPEYNSRIKLFER